MVDTRLVFIVYRCSTRNGFIIPVETMRTSMHQDIFQPGIRVSSVPDYARRENLSAPEIYKRIKPGEVEAVRLGKHLTLVVEREAAMA